jgi:crotonobetaine/carnitine-CoA ligase
MVGVASEVGEQDIKLFVQPKRGTTVDLAVLSCWLADRLAPYQNPRYLVLVDDFARTPSQRVIKRDLPRDTTDCWDRLRAG